MRISELESLTEEVPIYAPRLTRSPSDEIDDLPYVPAQGILFGLVIGLLMWIAISAVLFLVL